MQKNIIIATLCSTLLFGCQLMDKNKQIRPHDENRSILEKLADEEGPKVDSVDQTMLKSAIAADKKGQYAKAAQFYQQYLNSSKHAENKHVLAYGEALRRAGMHKESIKVYELVLDDDKNNVAAMEGKGLALLAETRTNEAIKLFGKVMQIDAARWKTANALGNAYEMKKKYKEALEYYKLAADLTNNNNHTILNNIAMTYMHSDDYDMAIKYLKKAAKIAPTKDKKHIDLNLSMAYGLSGDMERSAATARKHLPEHEVLNNLGVFANLSGDDEMARSYFNMALNRSPYFYKKASDNLEKLN